MKSITTNIHWKTHCDCEKAIIPRYHKGKFNLIPGLYCANHGKLIQWLNDEQYEEAIDLGILDIGPMNDDEAKVLKEQFRHRADQSKARQWNEQLPDTDIDNLKWTIGKYTNWYIKDLPEQYMRWAIMNIDDPKLINPLASIWLKKHPEYKL